MNVAGSGAMDRSSRRPRSRAWQRALVMLVSVALLAAACDGSPGRRSGRPAEARAPGASTGATPTAPEARSEEAPRPAAAAARLPAPNAPLPRDPPRLAAMLADTTVALRRAIAEWLERGDPATGAAPGTVVLLGLRQQRIYRLLALEPRLADRTIRRLPAPLRGEARDNVTAGARLLSLIRPVESVSFRTAPPPPAGRLLSYFKEAERRFGVDWEVLAAIMSVETRFHRIRSASYAGAQGPMQFIPSTWDAYGLGGNVHDPRDAVMGAANYLRASGAPGDYRAALHAYNPATEYVDAILLYARRMMDDPRDYYAYYSWQAFALTTGGDRRLTGPRPLR